METGTGAMKNCAAGSIPISFTSEEADNGEGTGYYAEIRIVHVGNCMGILCGKVRRCGAESVSVFSFLFLIHCVLFPLFHGSSSISRGPTCLWSEDKGKEGGGGGWLEDKDRGAWFEVRDRCGSS